MTVDESLPPGLSNARAGLCWHNGSIDEDVLTGEVFRTIRYVPAAASEFLRALRRLNRVFSPGDSSLPVLEFKPWPGWTVPDGPFPQLFEAMQSSVKIDDEAGEKGGIVPDLVIESPAWRLLVESEESKNYDAVQLIQQYLMSRITTCPTSRQTYQLLVGPTLARPGALGTDIVEIWETYRKPIEKAGITPGKGGLRDLLEHLLWIGWGEIEGVFNDLAHRLSPPESCMLCDCISVLNKKGHAHILPPVSVLQACSAEASSVEELRRSLTRAGRFPEDRLSPVLKFKNALLDLSSQVRLNRSILKEKEVLS